jgi:flagellar export protein FliJ
MTPKFSLQNVLDSRHTRVEALEIELGKLVAEFNKSENRLANLLQVRLALMGKLEHILMDELDLFKVDCTRADLRQAGEWIKKAEEERANLAQAAAAKRAQLVTARQAEEALNILKDKMIHVYNQEQAMIEARAQDEIYIARAYREQMTGA